MTIPGSHLSIWGRFRQMTVSLIAVFMFTTLVLYLAGAPPWPAYYHITRGALGSWIKFSHVIKAWIPLMLCSCGLLYTFRIGLWNIGVEGQVMIGAVLATAVLRTGVDGSAPMVSFFLAFPAAILGGSAWAIIAGWLKTRGEVHEIFAGLGMNFVAQGVILWLIFGPWKRPGVASMSGTALFPDYLWLSYVPGFRLSPVGLVMAIMALVATALMLRYTRIGLNLKAIGANARAAVLFGLRPGRYMLLAMAFGGGFAGLAGAVQVTGVYHRLIPSISSNYGYLALLVVMLANYNIWLVPLVALFFAGLNVGSIQLPIVLQVDSSLAGVIQGALVLTVLAVHGFREWRKIHRRRSTENMAAKEAPADV